MDTNQDVDGSGIEPTIEALTKGYDLLTGQIKSLQSRCGVGLGVLVAASPSAVFRFLRVMPSFLEYGWTWTYFIGFAGLVAFGFAIYFFLRGFFIDRLYLPYSKDYLVDSWQQGEHVIQLYRLSAMNTALDGLDSAAEEKRNQLRKGIISVIVGVLVFLGIEVLRYIVGLKGGEANVQS